MIEDKEQWIADLREMVDFLENHPELISEHAMICVGYHEPEEGEKLLPFLPELDCNNDHARFFGKHWIYLLKTNTLQGAIDDAVNGLQMIRDDLESV